MTFLDNNNPVLEQVEQFAKSRKYTLHNFPIMQSLKPGKDSAHNFTCFNSQKSHWFSIQQHYIQPLYEALSSCLFTKIH